MHWERLGNSTLAGVGAGQFYLPLTVLGPASDEPAAAQMAVPPMSELQVTGDVRRNWFCLGFNDEACLKRVVGCLLVATIPEPGLGETLEQLAGLRDYWLDYVSSPPALPESEARYYTGRVVDVRERPDLIIAE